MPAGTNDQHLFASKKKKKKLNHRRIITQIDFSNQSQIFTQIEQKKSDMLAAMTLQ